MRVTAIVQRITKIMHEVEMIYAEDALELITVFRKLGAVSARDQINSEKDPKQPNYEVLKHVWLALEQGDETGAFHLVVCEGSRDVIIYKGRPAVTREDINHHLASNSGMFSHFRGSWNMLQEELHS